RDTVSPSVERVDAGDPVRRVRGGRDAEPGVDHEQRVPRQGDGGRDVERGIGDRGNQAPGGQGAGELDRVDLTLVAADVEQPSVQLEPVAAGEQGPVQVDGAADARALVDGEEQPGDG